MKKNLLLLNILILSVLTIFAQNGFTSYPLVPSVSNARTGIKTDASGNKWITTFNRGVYKFDGTNWTSYDTLNSGIAANRINDIAFAASNIIWFATIKGISKFDGSTWTTYNTTNSGLPNDTVLCIYVNNTDTWIGTRNGLAKFDGSTWAVYNISNSGIINNHVTYINKDLLGDFWIGTLTGLCVKSGTVWIVYNENNSNMVRDQVNAIYINNNVKWIGTQNSGLFKFDNGSFTPLESLFFNIPLGNPYPSPYSSIRSISKGPQGGILINTFYEILSSQIHHYTLPNPYGNYFHAFDASTGLVWFVSNAGSGSSNVITSFNYQNYIGTTLLPEIPEYKVLDVNEVRAGLLNRGDMFWDLYGSQRARYEVPKYSGKNANFASALWIGGFDNGGILHQAAMTYRQNGVDYWPGPLDTLSGTTDSITSALYDKIWKIDRMNIQEFQTMFANGSVQNGTYMISNDILTWPAIGSGNYTRNMAPFVDVNGDGLYKPLIDGDYPKITGDQMCYWIFNDNLYPHQQTYGCAPLKAEVHVSAYAYTCSEITDSLKALNYTTFYNYDIFNRSTNNYTDTYIGNWADSDLGWYKDDYVGCNPSNNYGFEYNGAPVDGIGNLGSYGEKPPMISTVILNGPIAEPNDSIDNNNNGVVDETGEKNLMTHFQYFINTSDSVNGNPGYWGCNEHYYYLTGRWKNGAQITYGGDGITGSVPCNFMFDGVPSGTGWDEVSLNNVPDDRRFIMSCGPFNLNAGQHVNFNYAIVYTRDTASIYTITNLYNKNLADVKKVQQWYAASNYPSCYDLQMGVDAIQKDNNSVKIYPNPANSEITIDYKSQSKNVTIEIYNITGQKIKLLVYFNSQQTISIRDFVNGLYLLKINDGNNSFTQRFIKQ